MSSNDIFYEEFFLTKLENKTDNKRELLETLQRSYGHSIDFKLIQYLNIAIIPSLDIQDSQIYIIQQIKECDLPFLQNKIELFIKNLSDKLETELCELYSQYVNLSYNTFESMIIPTYELYVDELDFLLKRKLDVIINDILNDQENEKQKDFLVEKFIQLKHYNNITEVVCMNIPENQPTTLVEKAFQLEMNNNITGVVDGIVHEKHLPILVENSVHLEQKNNIIEEIDMDLSEKYVTILVEMSVQLEHNNNITEGIDIKVDENDNPIMIGNSVQLEQSINITKGTDMKLYKNHIPVLVEKIIQLEQRNNISGRTSINSYKNEKSIMNPLEKIKRFLKSICNINTNFKRNEPKYQTNKIISNNPLRYKITEELYNNICLISDSISSLFIEKLKYDGVISTSNDVDNSLLGQTYERHHNMDKNSLEEKNNVLNISLQTIYKKRLKLYDTQYEQFYNKFSSCVFNGTTYKLNKDINVDSYMPEVYYSRIRIKGIKKLLDHG